MRSPLAVGAAALLVLTAGLTTASAERTPPPVAAAAVSAAAPVPVPAAVPTPTLPAPLPTPSAAPSTPATPTPSRADLTAYRGLGTWLDAYDWAPEYRGQTGLAALDAMKQRGVRTLYLQAAKRGRRSDGMLSPALLGKWLVGAHQRGIRVQAWYLPLFDDVARDNALLDQIVDFRVRDGAGRLHAFDTVGLDIEWRNSVRDVAERNRRLVAVSRHLRAKAPHLPLAGIVVAPVVTEDVNRDFWNPFPWGELKPLFDVWQTMGYWTDRKSTSKWSDAYQSTVGNIRLLRRRLGSPGAPVHPIGGIGATQSAAEGFVRAARQEKALGGSLYDWPTTPGARYPALNQVPR